MHHSNKIETYLIFPVIIIFPFALVTGPFIPDLFVVVIDFLFIYKILKEKNYNLLNNKLFYLLIIFWVYISTRSLFSDYLLFSLKSSFFYLRFIIFVFAISYYLKLNEKILKYFFISLALVFFILLIDSTYQYIFGKNILGFETINFDKINSLFGNEAIMGSYLIRFLPLFFGLYILFFNINNSKKKMFLLFFLLNLILFMIFISGSRSSLFLTIIFFSLIFIFVKNTRVPMILSIGLFSVLILSLAQMNLKIKRSLIISFVDPLVTISGTEYPITDEYQPSFMDSPKILVKYNILDQIKLIFITEKEFVLFTKVHDSHYRTAFKMFQQNKLFGLGTKTYRKFCSDDKYYVNKFSCTTHPHNYYLQLLAENGIIGFIFLTFIFVLITYLIFKKSKNLKINFNNKDLCTLILLFGFFINLWPIVPNGNFFNNYLSIQMFLPLGFYLFLVKDKNEL